MSGRVTQPFTIGDDILDALVAAVAAQRSKDELVRLPEGDNPPRDRRGLPMQVLYPRDVNQTHHFILGETE